MHAYHVLCTNNTHIQTHILLRYAPQSLHTYTVHTHTHTHTLDSKRVFAGKTGLIGRAQACVRAHTYTNIHTHT